METPAQLDGTSTAFVTQGFRFDSGCGLLVLSGRVTRETDRLFWQPEASGCVQAAGPLSSWGCSSFGQSAALAKRRQRVRLPSSPLVRPLERCNRLTESLGLRGSRVGGDGAVSQSGGLLMPYLLCAPLSPPAINRKEMWMKSAMRLRVAFHRRWEEHFYELSSSGRLFSSSTSCSIRAVMASVREFTIV